MFRMTTFEAFQKIDIRVGEIIKVEELEDGKYSTHKLEINFREEIGVKKSCVIVINYSPEELKGKKVLAVVNFSHRQIGKNMSEVLTIGVPDDKNECLLVEPNKNSPLGAKLY